MRRTFNSDIFDATMEGLEKGLAVAHIATRELRTCHADDDVVEVLKSPDLRPFDQIPVTRDGLIVGVLHRSGELGTGSVADWALPLDDSRLVSAQTPLSVFLNLAEDGPYRMVVDAGRISGIATRSDLLKLPVRLLAFAVITHLETLMATAIHNRFPGTSWLQALSLGRRNLLEGQVQKLRDDKRDPDPLELTQFCDKRDILRKSTQMPAGFTSELREIERLRNQIAHAGTYAANDSELTDFLNRMKLAQRWIRHFQETQLDMG